MDSISRSDASASGTNHKEALKIEKKKTKVLKQALKEDRKAKEEIQKQLDQAKESIVKLNSQLQEKEKKYFDLYQEKMMMEETLIRESAQKKAGVRNYNEAPQLNKVQAPVSFVNPTNQSAEDFNSKESIFSFGEDGKPGEDRKTADESGESNESGKSEQDGQIRKKLSLTSPGEMASPQPQIRTVPQEQYDALKAKFLEEQMSTKKRLESIDGLESIIKKQAEKIEQMEREHLERLEMENQRREKVVKEAKEREKLDKIELQHVQEQKESAVKEEQSKTEAVRVELEAIREKHDQLSDEKFKVEEIVDKKVAQIERLNLELQRSKEEVETRKMMIDELGKSMLMHEKEEMEMASKLTMLKNQMMENDTGYGMSKKYGCVKKGLLKGLAPQACTVSERFVSQSFGADQFHQ